MVLFRRFCDPLLLVGILLLFVLNYSSAWLTNYSSDHPLHESVVLIDWLTGIGGILAIITGVVRPIVRTLLEEQYLAALVFYGGFWLILILPLLYLQFSGSNPAPAAPFYAGLLLILFCLINVLIAAGFLFAKAIRG
jgi:succinate-acetate transporter protein